MNKNFRNSVIAVLFLISFTCFMILLLIKAYKVEEEYIQKEPQISKLINKPDDVYIEIYRAPCRDNELIECIYMRIYPSVVEEIERHERSETNNNP